MGLFSNLLPIAGTAIGGFFGGAPGAMIGGSIGSGIGGHFNQRSQDRRAQQTEGQTRQYLNDINGIGKQYLEPYIGQGMEAGNMANDEYSRLLQDPQSFVNAILASYKPSEGYQFKENHLRRGAANTAAAGGFAGTQYDTDNQSALINALLSDDMQQYFNNVSGAYGTGLSGKENVAGRGFNASSNLADFLGSNASQQAGLTYKAGNERNANRADYQNQQLQNAQNIGGGLFDMYRNRQQPTGASAPPGGAPYRAGHPNAYGATVPGAAWMR